MSCIIQTPPGVPHLLYPHQTYFLRHPSHTTPSTAFWYMDGPAGEPTEESLLFQSLTGRPRAMTSGEGESQSPDRRRSRFTGQTKCHFTSCPPDCDNPSHVVVLGPVSLYNVGEGQETGRPEAAYEGPVKPEPYYPPPSDHENVCYLSDRDREEYEHDREHRNGSRILYVETSPSGPTPANSPVKVSSAHGSSNYNEFFEVEGVVYHQGEQYSRFRSPASPSESSVASCASSTLSLLSLMNATPQRRHSFSATVANSTSLSSLSLASTHGGNSGGGSVATSSSYRQRSYTYSNSPSKVHPYSLPKRLSASTTSSQGEPRDYHTAEGFRSIRSVSSLSDDHDPHASDHDHELEHEHEARSISGSDTQDSEIRRGQPGTEQDFGSYIFLGPVGKKRRMVRERQLSLGPEGQPLDDPSPEEDLSPGSDSTQTSQSLKQETEDAIAEEDEDEDAQPLNLCLGEEDLERVKRLDINCPSGQSANSSLVSPPQAARSRIPLSPQLASSVLREHLLGIATEMGSPPQGRERVGSMSSGSQPSPPWMGRGAGAPESMSATTSVSADTPQQAGAGGKQKKKLKCPICAKEFSQLRNYRYHCSRHAGTDQFACTCPICHKVFNDKGYLGSHMKIHNNKKEYHCEWCEKRFNQRVAYNMHVRIHTGVKPHQCHLCTKAFSRKMLLRQHLRTHTGERPYSCEVCGKAFADRSNMLLHQRLHTGQRPYMCTYPKCGKSFSKNHHLKTHLNHHAGIKPYQCEKCLACFSQSSNMKTHFRKCTGTNNQTSSTATSAAGGPNQPQSHPGSMTNLTLTAGPSSLASGQMTAQGTRTRTSSLGSRVMSSGTNYPSLGGFRTPASPEEAARALLNMQPRRRSIPRAETIRLEAARCFDISGVRGSYPSAGPYDGAYQGQGQEFVGVPRSVESAAYRYEQGRALGFPETLIPPMPLASSLPLNFELHTLQSRNPLFQAMPRTGYEAQQQQAWVNSANYRQPSNFSPRKESP